jgi:AhpD family alkylhydroperoxidase
MYIDASISSTITVYCFYKKSQGLFVMDKKDEEKIQQIIKERKQAHHTFVSKDSPVYKAFLEMEGATYRERALSRRTKELIAVGISVVLNCESCMEWHIREALKDGASEDQVLEAVEVGIEMGGGPATVSSRFALKVLKYYKEHESER